MTTCFLAPDPIQSTQFIPGGNVPANGGQLFFYAAGSSVKQTVYKDNAANTSWTNPIVLDSGGNLPSGGEVWFPQGQTFKVIFAPANDSDPPLSPYWTKDNLSGTNDVSAQVGTEWITGPTPTFVSGTQFTLSGDQTTTFTAQRRIKTSNTAGTVYSTVINSNFGAGTTTVNVVNDSGALDSGLSAVFYGILDPANPSLSAPIVNRKGANIASSGTGTTNIWSAVGDYVHITGTNAIAHFSTAPYAGATKELCFDGVLTVINGAMISVPGGLNSTTSASTMAMVRAETVSTYSLTDYRLGSGFYQAPAGSVSTVSFRSGTQENGSWSPDSSSLAWSVAGVEVSRFTSSRAYLIGTTQAAAGHLAAGDVTMGQSNVIRSLSTPKAMVQFNGVNTTLSFAFNVPSVTKGGTGNYVVSFTNFMSTSAYAVNITCSNEAEYPCIGITTKNSSSFQFTVVRRDSGAAFDPQQIHAVVFGLGQ